MAPICIIVPIFKVASYLKECLDSIRKQTYIDFQAILVDDGSPEEDAILAEEYALQDSRFTCIHKANGGLSSARNKALDLCHSRYVMFIDSDDFVDTDILEYLMKIIKTKDVDIAQCSSIGFNETSQCLWTTALTDANELTLLSSREACRLFFSNLGQNIATAWEKIYKITLWENIRFPEGVLYEDSRTLYKIFYSMNKMVWSSNPMYHYRVRSGSIMRAPEQYSDFSKKTDKQEQLEYFIAKNDEEFIQLALKSRIIELLHQIKNKKLSSNNRKQLKDEIENMADLRPKVIRHNDFLPYIEYKHPVLFLFQRLYRRIVRLCKINIF